MVEAVDQDSGAPARVEVGPSGRKIIYGKDGKP